jgi:hypothetical protein
MKKQTASGAWGILIASLPRAIAAFVVAVAGISIGVPLAVLFIGLPVLAATLIGCRELMVGERRLISAWEGGGLKFNDRLSETYNTQGAEQQGGWRGWLATMAAGYNYRGLVYGILQLPISIAAFTLAVVIPITAIALTLSPLADMVSSSLFSFDLFAGQWLLDHSILAGWSSFQRSMVVAGIGAVFLLLTPPILRSLGRLYAAWINWICGSTAITKSEPQF